MINQIIKTPHSMAATFIGFSLGLGLVLTGAFLGHTASVIGGLCGSGSVLVLGSCAFGALKADYFFRQKRIEERNKNAEAAYTPNSLDRNDWKNFREKNAHMNVAKISIRSTNRNIRANPTLDDLNRPNIGLGDSDL